MMKKKNPATLKDVAKLAGVSASTVSRVLSDNSRISEPTKKNVLKCMDELGYHPNAIARSLAIRKSGAVGIIMPSTSEDVLLNPFFPEALRGIAKSASRSGYDLLLSTNSEKNDELKIIKKFINGSKVDGIILMSSRIHDECIKYLCSIDFPFSVIGSTEFENKSINTVDNDNYNASYELTLHLISTGRKNIAMIAGDRDLILTSQRVEGYKKALIKSGIEFNEDMLFTGSFDEKTGYELAEKINKLVLNIDGLIVTDDLVAFGAIRFFSSAGTKIPQQIAVASFNNSALSKYIAIPLTSVDINSVMLGEESMNLLSDAIENKTRGKKILIPYTIYKRKSTMI